MRTAKLPACMKSVLLIQTAFIGDLILSTVLIENLHLHYPNARIDFLVRKGNEEVLQSHPYVRKVLTWDKKKGKYRSLLALLKQVRKEQYDLVINVQRYAATGLLAGLSRGKIIVGYDKNPLSFLFTKKVKHIAGTAAEPVHETTRCNQLLQTITSTPVTKPGLYPSPADYSSIRRYQQEPYLVLAPGSVWFTKQVPVSKWTAILKHLPIRQKIYIIGTKKEQAVATAIMNELPAYTNIESLAGLLSILQSAALMQGALFNLVNDSAPLHIASAVNAPVIALFCSTIPGFGFTPLSDESYIVQAEAQLSCRPCGNHGKAACPKRHFDCANLINDERVASIILRKILQQQAERTLKEHFVTI